ncbi:MAG: histidine phosphatase family protein [Patescibacteria group bacterium]|nr:histidine phosphatase family protein [Patescibacteria group bacterium]
MRFILVRHGTTDWNEQNRIQGHTNNNLNDQGFEDAKETAKKLMGLGITKIISSPLNRAVQTTIMIYLKLKVDVSLNNGLEECSFGAVEGLTLPEARKQFRGILTHETLYSCKHYDYRPVGGEDSVSVMKRFIQVLEDCRQKFTEDDIVLIVAHGWLFCTMLTALGNDNPMMQRGEYRIIEY